jgi:hypothetical protein
VRGSDDYLRFIVLGCVLLAVGVLSYAYVISASGGLERFLSVSRTALRYEEISGYIVNLMALVPLGLLIVLSSSYHVPRYAIFKRLALAATGVYGLWCIYSGTRSGIIFVAVIILGSVYGARRRNPPLFVATLAFIAVVVLVGFIVSYRGSMYNGQFNSNESVGDILETSLESYTEHKAGGGASLGSEFGMSLAVVAFVPGTVPFDYGYMLLELVTNVVPRAWWPGKVYPSGQEWDRIHRVAGTAGWVNAAGYLSGPAPGLIGKYYYMAGPFGVFFGALWTGVFLQILRSYAARYAGLSGFILAVGWFILGFYEMNNPLLWPMSWLPSTGLGIFLAVVVGRRGARSMARARNRQPVMLIRVTPSTTATRP